MREKMTNRQKYIMDDWSTTMIINLNTKQRIQGNFMQPSWQHLNTRQKFGMIKHNYNI